MTATAVGLIRRRVFFARPARWPDWVHEEAACRAVWFLAQFRILTRKRSFERLRQAGGLNSFAFRCIHDGRSRGSQKRITRPGHLDGQQRQARRVERVEFSQKAKNGGRLRSSAYSSRKSSQRLLTGAVRGLAQNVPLENGLAIIGSTAVLWNTGQHGAKFLQHHGPADVGAA